MHGGLLLAGYLYTVGPAMAFDRLTGVTPLLLGVVAVLVILERLADWIGVAYLRGWRPSPG